MQTTDEASCPAKRSFLASLYTRVGGNLRRLTHDAEDAQEKA
jgi:hypothetical protein